MSTIDPIVQDEYLPQPPVARPRRRRWIPALAILAVLAVAGYLWADRYTAGLYALAPGEARPVNGYMTAPSGVVHTHRGRILLVTVSLQTVKPLSWIRDKLNSDVQLVDEKALVGNDKSNQLRQVDAIQMQTSTQTAVIVALRRLGYRVDLQNRGAVVAEVVARSPADGYLVPGDVITTFGGVPITTSDALVAAIRQHRSGSKVSLTVQPPTGPPRSETVTLGVPPPGSAAPGPPHAFLGIASSTKVQVTLPVNVRIDPGNIGGPSAGLAFTLGIIDELTAGDLTGGHLIAVTGTINPDGTVGEVGGVVQKTAAVRKSGALAFLVPPGEYAEARKHAGRHLKVIKVTSLEDALHVLASLGGDLSAVPRPPPAISG